MENICLKSWHLIKDTDDLPEPNRDLLILIEDDVVYDSRDYWPTVRKASMEVIKDDKRSTGYQIRWKLLDYNRNNEEEYLHTNSRTVIAWRIDTLMVDKKDSDIL